MDRSERSGCNAPIKPRRSSRAGASFDLTKQTKQSCQTKQICQAGFRPGWAHGGARNACLRAPPKSSGAPICRLGGGPAGSFPGTRAPRAPGAARAAGAAGSAGAAGPFPAAGAAGSPPAAAGSAAPSPSARPRFIGSPAWSHPSVRSGSGPCAKPRKPRSVGAPQRANARAGWPTARAHAANEAQPPLIGARPRSDCSDNKTLDVTVVVALCWRGQG